MALNKNPKYDVKRKYFRILEISLIISLSLLIIAFKYFPDVQKTEEGSIISPDILIVVPPPIVDYKSPPPPPKPPIPIEAPTDDVLDDVEFAPTDFVEDAVVLPPPPPKEIDDTPIPDFFIVVEEMPKPIGGIEGIQKLIIYPEIATRSYIQGKVYVKAFVDKNGNVVKVKLLKGIGGGCDEIAMKAVRNTLFIPGKQRGKAVKVQLTIPITFKLQ